MFSKGFYNSIHCESGVAYVLCFEKGNYQKSVQAVLGWETAYFPAVALRLALLTRFCLPQAISECNNVPMPGDIDPPPALDSCCVLTRQHYSAHPIWITPLLNGKELVRYNPNVWTPLNPLRTWTRNTRRQQFLCGIQCRMSAFICNVHNGRNKLMQYRHKSVLRL